MTLNTNDDGARSLIRVYIRETISSLSLCGDLQCRVRFAFVPLEICYLHRRNGLFSLSRYCRIRQILFSSFALS